MDPMLKLNLISVYDNESMWVPDLKVCWHLRVRGTGFDLIVFRKSRQRFLPEKGQDCTERQSEKAPVIWRWPKDSRKPLETGWNYISASSESQCRLSMCKDWSKNWVRSKSTRSKTFRSYVLFETAPVWKAVGRAGSSILMVIVQKLTLSSSSILLSRVVDAAPLPSLPCRGWCRLPSSSLYTYTHTKKKTTTHFWVLNHF